MNGPVAVVTGASQGIGASIARRLAKDGFSIALCDIADCEQVAEQVRDSHGEATSVRVDVTNRTEVLDLAAELSSMSVDVVVNCAGGIVSHASLMHGSEDLWARTMDLNLHSVRHMIQAFAPVMRGKGSGSIVNVTSTSSTFCWPGGAHYQVAKAGLVALTKAAAFELGAFGIRVNAVAPATTRTPRLHEAFQAHPEFERHEASLTSLGRIAEPDDIADVVAFLAGPDSRYVTGVELLCDGGYSLSGQTFPPLRDAQEAGENSSYFDMQAND